MNKNGFRLFFLGFLTLYLELVLIRYLAGNIWNLGYFPNLVLIAAFIGLGLGFIFHHNISKIQSRKIYALVPSAISFLLLFVFLFHPTVPIFKENIAFSEFFFSGVQSKSNKNVQWLLFILWFCGTATIFIVISQYTAKLFAKFKPLIAYTLDIGGSCFGILAFMLFSWLQIDAFFWFISLIVLFCLTLDSDLIKLRTTYLSLLLLLISTIAFVFPQQFVFWSPYQKIDYKIYDNDPITEYIANDFIQNKYYPATIYVNNLFSPHQFLFNAEQLQELMYQRVHEYRKDKMHLPPYQDVLIIGAGTGNDVASALFNGAEHIDAIEIDPVILEIGLRYHPAKPYQNPKVSLYKSDGRVFLNQTKKKYDLIIYSLTDSLIKVSPVAQLRLENYLYTKESLRQASQLLKENGSLVFYRYYNREWLLAKVAALFAYGSQVTPDEYYNIIVFNKYNNDRAGSDEEAIAAANFVSGMEEKYDIDLPDNDWPFLYLKNHKVPTFYLYAMAILSLMIAGLVWLVYRRSQKSDIQQNKFMQLAFILMGVAFLLLETKSVIQFSLLFGTTWINNSLVFLSVLLLVLLANWTAQMIKSEKLIIISFLLLFISCMIIIAYPIANLLTVENIYSRYVLASLIIFSPIYFANLIFSSFFRTLPTAECYFGWNLIGATLGGLLEYLSMAWGYNSLAYIVLLCYVIVFILYLFKIDPVRFLHARA